MASVLAFSGLSEASEPLRPNIIHIMVDDLGWRDLSIYGSETFHTPNIDALAERGIRYSNAYSASPLCSPTRASTLTGQTAGRIRFTRAHGHVGQAVLDPREADSDFPGYPMTTPGSRTRLPLNTPTIARVLKEQGYHTALMGKWHLGHEPYIPENYGFDVVIGGRGTPGPPQGRFFGPWDEVANLPEVEGHPNVDDVLGDEAVKYIERHADEPFFLALWPYNVHAPFQGRPEEIEAYSAAAESARYQRLPTMASMVKTLDDNVGKVMSALERLNLIDNTIVIFTSDNGGNMYNRPEGENPTSNYPLRAGKGNNYEGGIRVPLIVSWPGQIAFNTVTDAVNISYDFFPTVLDVLDISAPEGWHLDGKSALPVWRGEKGFERGPVYTVFTSNMPMPGNIANVAMRDGKWKLLRFFHTGRNQEDEYELYDLSVDVGETRNLAFVYPETTSRMAEEMVRHLQESATLLPRLNPDYDPDLILGGFQVVGGGILAGGKESAAKFLTNNHQLILRYHIPESTEPGNTLSFAIETNCAVSAVAGHGETPVFGKPEMIEPNLTNQNIQVKIGANVSSGIITVVLDIEQPGVVNISDARII